MLKTKKKLYVVYISVLHQEQFTAFSHALETANQSIVNRSTLDILDIKFTLVSDNFFKISHFSRTKFVREIYQSMEQGLTLIGATGIEDRLQDKVSFFIQKCFKS